MAVLWTLAWSIPAYLIWGIGIYFACLFVLSRIQLRSPRPDGEFDGLFVLVVPAHNEAAVISTTIAQLKALEGCDFHVVVVDDGSTDDTAEVASDAIDGDGRFTVVSRDPEEAGAGKGAVVNHGYRTIGELRKDPESRLAKVAAGKIVVGIVDADGLLDHDTLARVGPYFADPAVGAVQISVSISNARKSILTRLQDIDFVGFSLAVQTARDRLGSVGHGGNGHFARYSALKGVSGEEGPWTHSLTEDLDLGLRMTVAGWVTRFCPDVFVNQEAPEKFRAMVRQRTRWIQGHFASWSFLPKLWDEKAPIPLRTRIDYSLYLTMISMLLVMFIYLMVGLGALTGMYSAPLLVSSVITNPIGYLVFILTLSFLPCALFTAAYQIHSRNRLKWRAVPFMIIAFAIYHYAWGVPASIRALTRLARRRNGWAKTDRVGAIAPEEAEGAQESEELQLKR